MKSLLALCLASLCSLAVADELVAQPTQVGVEPYRYAQHLDIAHVVSSTEVANLCEVVPVQITYDDSTGSRHVMEYLVMGTGCTN